MKINYTMIQDQIALEKLQKFLRTNELPHTDLDNSLKVKGRIFLGYYENDGELVGSGGLELHGDSALLRSVAVRNTHRGKSLGKKIVNDLVTKARELKVMDIFLLTETAQDFFTRNGFKEISREEVPKTIKSSSEFVHICPASAVCMYYKLTE